MARRRRIPVRPTLAAAQDFPTKPIKLIVPFPAGGPNDIIARVVGQRMSEITKQPIIIDNRAVQGGVLRPKGELVASLRHDHELLVAEVIFRGVLDDASPAEAAALVSCLIEEARSAEDEPSRRLLRDRPRLRRGVRRMEEDA